MMVNTFKDKKKDHLFKFLNSIDEVTLIIVENENPLLEDGDHKGIKSNSTLEINKTEAVLEETILRKEVMKALSL